MPKKARSAASAKARKARRPMPQQRPAAPVAPRPYAAPFAAPGAAQPVPHPTARGRTHAVLGDYSYVGPELRRIGTMAAIIFVIMGALAVLLR